MKAPRKPVFFATILLNLAGAAYYLVRVSDFWVEPELANIPGAAGGDAVAWFFTATPILISFASLNLVLVSFLLLPFLERKEWVWGVLAVVIPPLVWAIAYCVDNAHHGI